MLTDRMTDVIDKLPALNRSFTRAEIVTAQLQEAAARLNAGFNRVAIRRTRFAIAAILKPKFVYRAVVQGRCKRAGKRSGLGHAVAGVFLHAQRTTILVIISGEVLLV